MNVCTNVERRRLRRLLERDLYGVLRLPVAPACDPGDEVEESSEPARPRLSTHFSAAVGRSLAASRNSAGVARQAAEAVGAIPRGYPWHVALVMRAVNAVLPWYTRTVRQAAFRAVETLEMHQTAMESIAGSLDEIRSFAIQQANPPTMATKQGDALRPAAGEPE